MRGPVASPGALTPVENGQVVYDPAQGVYWLADANLAADPKVRDKLKVQGIDDNGAMDFQTALNWVAALNAYNGGAGWLGHGNWQLPVGPKSDGTCGDTGAKGGSFGPDCQASALGALFYVGLKGQYPTGVAPNDSVGVAQLFNDLKLSYYWAAQNDGGQGGGKSGGGQEMFSFVSSIQAGTTTNDIYYYVLPKRHGYIGGAAPACPRRGPKVWLYDNDQAVFDCVTGDTWPADANLAASTPFRVGGTVTINDNNGPLTPRKIDHGAMLFATAQEWIQNMRTTGYLTVNDWELPADWKDFHDLVADMALQPGDAGLASPGQVGPFKHLQPFFYWGCQRGPRGTAQSPCPAVWTTQQPAPGFAPPANTKTGPKAMAWSFDFGHGVQSTSAVVQKYFVMVYYTPTQDGGRGPAPPTPPRCTNARQCCALSGGAWIGGRCEL